MTSINTDSIDKYIADNTVNRFLGWLGCFFVCVGAVAVTLDLDPINVYALNIGSIIYGIWGFRTKQWNQVIVNMFLISVYSLGIVWRLI